MLEFENAEPTSLGSVHLREYGYPPDRQEEAVKTVLAQAELICSDWDGQTE